MSPASEKSPAKSEAINSHREIMVFKVVAFGVSSRTVKCSVIGGLSHKVVAVFSLG